MKHIIHVEDPDRPNWCSCGLAGLYETPGVWVCPRSVKPETHGSGPVVGGFMLGR